MTIESIRELVSEDLNKTDQFIVSQLASPIPLIKQLVEYVLNCGGKRIRPIILLLSTKAVSSKTENHVNLAAVIELIHTATLLHDDVVDNQTIRRGNKTANSVWGNNASVLIGDFLYSRAFQVVVDLNHQEILDIFAKATHLMAEGEIMQLVNCRNPDTTESFYYDIIERKTAKLFEIASQLGGILANSHEVEMNALRDYGKFLGLAYQLIDDAMDYSNTEKQTGKSLGLDLADGKTTLPLIYALTQVHGKEKENIRNAILHHESADLEKILAIISATGAIDYTALAAKSYAEKAKQSISLLNASPYRDALCKMADFVVCRDY